MGILPHQYSKIKRGSGGYIPLHYFINFYFGKMEIDIS